MDSLVIIGNSESFLIAFQFNASPGNCQAVLSRAYTGPSFVRSGVLSPVENEDVMGSDKDNYLSLWIDCEEKMLILGLEWQL
jgi:hypothetical protein